MKTPRLSYRILTLLASAACVWTGLAQSSITNSPGDPFNGLATFTQQRTDRAAEGTASVQLVDADVFWRTTALNQPKPNGYDLWGMNLRYANAIERTGTRITATVPIYFSNDDSSSLSTYWMSGLDVNLEQPIGEILAVGIHGAWLHTDNDVDLWVPRSHEDTSIGGVYVAARYQVTDWLRAGAAVSYDRNVMPTEDSGVIGVGTSLAFKLCEKADLVPRAMYFNNHDLKGFSDKDSFEVGTALRYHFSEVWTIGAGYQTTLGSRYIDSSHMGFLATSFRF